MEKHPGVSVIKKELFHGKWDIAMPISPLDGYKYGPNELTFFSLTLDEKRGGIDFFTLAERLD